VSLKIFGDDEKRDPVVPKDIGRPPPKVAPDGTAASGNCGTSFPLKDLNVTAAGYQCSECERSGLAPPAPTDGPAIKVGRGRWWLAPLAVVAVGVTAAIDPDMIIWVGFFVIPVFGALLIRFKL